MDPTAAYSRTRDLGHARMGAAPGRHVVGLQQKPGGIPGTCHLAACQESRPLCPGSGRQDRGSEVPGPGEGAASRGSWAGPRLGAHSLCPRDAGVGGGGREGAGRGQPRPRPGSPAVTSEPDSPWGGGVGLLERHRLGAVRLQASRPPPVLSVLIRGMGSRGVTGFFGSVPAHTHFCNIQTFATFCRELGLFPPASGKGAGRR